MPGLIIQAVFDKNKRYNNLFVLKMCIKYFVELSKMNHLLSPISSHWRYKKIIPTEHRFVNLESWISSYY
jgi:hypothetical protein